MRTRLILPLALALVGLTGCAVYTPYGHRGGQVYGGRPAVVIRPAPVIVAPAPVVVRPSYRSGHGRYDSKGGRGRYDSEGRRGRHDSDGGRGRHGSDGGRGGRDSDGDGADNRSDRWPNDPRRW